MDHHRVEERRGFVGKVVARYGGEDYIAVDVRLADGQYRLFWPRDLEEIPYSRAWWRLLLGRDYGQVALFSAAMWPTSFGPVGEERAPQEMSTR
jgi:hypothetical protein